MALFWRYSYRVGRHEILCYKCAFSSNAAGPVEDEEFTRQEVLSHKRSSAKTRNTTSAKYKSQIFPPRYKSMPVDQHWPSVWPAAASFRPSVVPLPLHQGYLKKGAPPGKNANLELLKIPNFLHLTPPAIKAHCAAIKKFCTAWPEELKDREGFPVEIITSDYCHSGPTIRDPKSRIVTLRIKLSELHLEPKAMDKLRKLVGDRYDKESDMLTLVADRCPTRKQNREYLQYLLTALYHQSSKEEKWEEELSEEDWLEFKWNGSEAQKKLLRILKATDHQANDEELLGQTKYFGEALTQLINDGEKPETMEKYKATILPLLKLHPLPGNVV